MVGTNASYTYVLTHVVVNIVMWISHQRICTSARFSSAPVVFHVALTVGYIRSNADILPSSVTLLVLHFTKKLIFPADWVVIYTIPDIFLVTIMVNF